MNVQDNEGGNLSETAVSAAGSLLVLLQQLLSDLQEPNNFRVLAHQLGLFSSHLQLAQVDNGREKIIVR